MILIYLAINRESLRYCKEDNVLNKGRSLSWLQKPEGAVVLKEVSRINV